MSIEEDIGKFAARLDHRNSEYERKLRFTHSENGRLRLKNEAAELHVIQAKFDKLLGQHLPGRQRQCSAAQ